MCTADQNIKYQQNLKNHKLSLIVLGANRWRYVREHLPEIIAAIK